MLKRLVRTALIVCGFSSVFLPVKNGFASLSSKDCLACHGDADIVEHVVAPSELEDSVHSGFECTDCHSDVVDAPHEVTPASVNCASCHEDTAEAYAASFHKSALSESIAPVPDCASCHGDHEIRGPSDPESLVHPGHVIETCKTCHADPSFIASRKFELKDPFLKQYAKWVHRPTPEVKPQSMEDGVVVSDLQKTDVSNQKCFSCHGDATFERFVDPAAYRGSMHGKLLCTSCHKDAEGSPHPLELKSVSCASCHRLETQIYLSSDHGKAVGSGISEAASCKSCHGDPHQLVNVHNPNSPVHRSHVPETCAKCHDNADLMKQFHLNEPHPYASYMKSVHGKAHEEGKQAAAVCTDCHGSHDLHGARNPDSKIYKFNIPKTCAKCHENVAKTYELSIHGGAIREGITDAPVCTDCHGEHQIEGPKGQGSPVSSLHVVETCSHCHGSERIAARYGLPADRVESYLKSYHGLARQGGSLVAANCASCHGFHDVLPSTDPRSSIHPDNLAETCGKCHPGAGPQMAQAKVHISSTSGEHISIKVVRLFYVWLIFLVIGFMLIHNALDFTRKLVTGEQAVFHEKEMRLSVNERIQHVVLIICFVGLAYTGLCHRYPRALWAQPLMVLEGGSDIRRFLHRAFAVIFVGLSFYHALWLMLSARGRKELKALLLGWQDFKDMLALLLYNLGFRKTKPAHRGKFLYIEKLEYWALVWGSLVMTVTGFFLTYENLTLKHFPKWIIDLALTFHFYEAVLAILAIIVWHFYWTIFDPDVYPMNWSWLTGFIKKKKKDESGAPPNG